MGSFGEDDKNATKSFSQEKPKEEKKSFGADDKNATKSFGADDKNATKSFAQEKPKDEKKSFGADDKNATKSFGQDEPKKNGTTQSLSEGVPVHVNPVIMKDTMADANLGMKILVGHDN